MKNKKVWECGKERRRETPSQPMQKREAEEFLKDLLCSTLPTTWTSHFPSRVILAPRPRRGRKKTTVWSWSFRFVLYCRVVFFSSPNERKSLENEREGLSAHKKKKKKQNSQGPHLPLTLSVFAFCLGIESTRKTKVLFAVFGFGEGVVGLSWVSLVFLVRSRVSRSNSSLCASFVFISVRVLRLTKKDNRKKERRKEGKKKKKKGKNKKTSSGVSQFTWLHLTALGWDQEAAKAKYQTHRLVVKQST